MDNSYYVYMYMKPDGTPFYVGKGKEGRHLFHLQEAKKDNPKDNNKLKINTIRKILKQGLEPEIRFIDTNLDEDTAFELEEFLISEIGRVDLGTGTLTNLTNGGEGCKGKIISNERKEQLRIQMSGENNPNYGKTGDKCIWWGRTHTEETKEKMSAWQKGLPKSEQAKQNMRKPKSEEGRLAIAEAQRKLRESGYRPSEESNKKRSKTLKGRPSPNKGRTRSEDERRKQSEATRGKSKPKKLCPHCNKEVATHLFDRWHGENCKEKIHAEE